MTDLYLNSNLITLNTHVWVLHSLLIIRLFSWTLRNFFYIIGDLFKIIYKLKFIFSIQLYINLEIFILNSETFLFFGVWLMKLGGILVIFSSFLSTFFCLGISYHKIPFILSQFSLFVLLCSSLLFYFLYFSRFFYSFQ